MFPGFRGVVIGATVVVATVVVALYWFSVLVQEFKWVLVNLRPLTLDRHRQTVTYFSTQQTTDANSER